MIMITVMIIKVVILIVISPQVLFIPETVTVLETSIQRL